MDDVKLWLKRDGAVLVRVDWFEADGRVSNIGVDAVAPELVVADNAVGWISVEDVKPHAYHFDRVSREGDEVFLVGKGAEHRVVLSPMWLGEQVAQLKDFRARVVVPAEMKDELNEFVRQADEA